MHSTGSRFVKGPSSILFGGVYVCTFQPGNFTGCGSEEVSVQSTTVTSGWVDKSVFYDQSTSAGISGRYHLRTEKKENRTMKHNPRGKMANITGVELSGPCFKKSTQA